MNMAVSTSPTAPPRCLSRRRSTPAGRRLAVGGSWVVTSLIADPRVDDRVQEVDEQVDDDELQREDEHQALHRGVIAGFDRLDEQPAEAVEVEHRFDYYRAGQQEAELQADYRNDRNEGVPQGVLVHDGPLDEAFGAGGAHVIAADRFQEAGTRKPRDRSEARDRQGYERQDDAFGREAARDRQQFQFN